MPYNVLNFGQSGEPIIVIDDFASDPLRLVAAAEASVFAKTDSFYPGVRAGLDPTYLTDRGALMQSILVSHFGMSANAGVVGCNFSLVTTPPEDLIVNQRLPHVDTTDSGRLALLHYLCQPEQGGTAFYRHRASGLEVIRPEGFAAYSKLVDDEIAERSEPQEDYVRASNWQFEMTGQVDARFNRLIIYRGWQLHSGLIPKDMPLSPDPARGRLTINTFLQVR